MAMRQTGNLFHFLSERLHRDECAIVGDWFTVPLQFFGTILLWCSKSFRGPSVGSHNTERHQPLPRKNPTRGTHRENFSKFYQINPKSDCFYHAPIDLEHKRTCPFVFQINRKMINTIWFRIDLTRLRKVFSVCMLLISPRMVCSICAWNAWVLILAIPWLFGWPGWA